MADGCNADSADGAHRWLAQISMKAETGKLEILGECRGGTPHLMPWVPGDAILFCPRRGYRFGRGGGLALCCFKSAGQLPRPTPDARRPRPKRVDNSVPYRRVLQFNASSSASVG